MKKIIAVMLLVLMLFSFTACTGKAVETNATTGANTQKEILKVGLECAYAPFNWTQLDDSNGGIPISGTKQFAGGYDIEIAKIIADGLNMDLQIVKFSDFGSLIPAVQSGVIDVIIAGMSPTAERKKSIDFSDNYYTSDLVIVVKADSKYASATSLKDFSGAKIVGQKGTFHATVVSQIPGVLEQTPMDSFGTMRVALESGTIDGYVSERPGAFSAIASNPKLAMVTFAEGKGFTASDEDVSIAVGLKKGSELTSKINEVLSGVSKSQRSDLMDQALKNQPEE